MAPSQATSATTGGEVLLGDTSTGQGGWRTAPFIIVTMVGLTMASGGWGINLIVFLIQEFNIKSIDAAQISNFVSGCTSFFPLIAAILADAFFGCFSIIWISSLISLLGLVIMVLTVTLPGLRPPDCATGSGSCATPSRLQYAVLYIASALVSIGIGGSRFTLGTMGANQFSRPDHQAAYFNWYFIALYAASFISATGIVYVEDNVNWATGFGICVAANVIGLMSFLAGSQYYKHDRPQGSPFTGLVRAVVASVRKRKVKISSHTAEYYYGEKGTAGNAPTKSLSVLNRAALKTDGDIHPNGSIAKPWKLCTVHQVEDLKTLIKILPLWSSSIFLSTPIGVQLSLTVLQALATDRHVGGHQFQIPASSMIVFTFLSTFVCLSLFGHCLWPLWRKVSGRHPTSLQKVGVGHVLSITSMAVSALVESKRRRARPPISVLWLVPQMAIVGSGEACHFPGQVELYYQEFPSSLKSMSTAMISMLIGAGFYLSTAVVDLVRRETTWLPDNIDEGRVDNVYWMLVVIGVLNYGYFLVCCWFYENKNVHVEVNDG